MRLGNSCCPALCLCSLWVWFWHVHVRVIRDSTGLPRAGPVTQAPLSSSGPAARSSLIA